MTVLVRNKLIEQVGLYSSVDGTLAERAAYGGTESGLVTLGMDTFARANVVKGIELFTDFDQLVGELFEEGVTDEGV